MTDIATFSFEFLSPSRILDSLETLGIRVDSGLTALNSYENRVYQFRCEDNLRYVAKFYRPQRWNASQILEEHEFTQQLFDAKLSVIAPLAINNTTLHEQGGVLFALFPSVRGYQYEIDNNFHMESVASALANVHQVGAQHQFSHRPKISLEEYLYQPQEILLTCPHIPKSIQYDFALTLAKLIAVTEKHWHSDWQAIRLHADCHPGNILWNEKAIFVDFDDARMGPAIQDLWMLLQGDRQEQQLQLNLLIDIYQEYRDFNPAELRLIEPLRAMRMVYHLAWIIKRWQDPAFPIAFPWIKEADFWHQQLRAFNQQIEAITSPPLNLMMGM